MIEIWLMMTLSLPPSWMAMPILVTTSVSLTSSSPWSLRAQVGHLFSPSISYLAKALKGGRHLAIATREATACVVIATTIFTGKGKFSFDQYHVGRHQHAHYELLWFLEEPVAETKKVTDFLAGICDPKLE
jgi:hypothetical protein